MKKIAIPLLLALACISQAQTLNDTITQIPSESGGINNYFFNSLSYGTTLGRRKINSYPYNSTGFSINFSGVYSTQKMGIEYSGELYRPFFNAPSKGFNLQASYLMPFKKSGKPKGRTSGNQNVFWDKRGVLDSTKVSVIVFKGFKFGLEYADMNNSPEYIYDISSVSVADKMNNPFSQSVNEHVSLFGLNAGFYSDRFMNYTTKQRYLFSRKTRTIESSTVTRFGIELVGYPFLQREQQLPDVNLIQQKNTFGLGARASMTVISEEKFCPYTKFICGYHPVWGTYLNISLGVDIGYVKK